MVYKYKHKRLEGFKNYVIKKPRFLGRGFEDMAISVYIDSIVYAAMLTPSTIL